MNFWCNRIIFEEILGVFRGGNCDFYALKWEEKWVGSGGAKITIK